MKKIILIISILSISCNLAYGGGLPEDTGGPAEKANVKADKKVTVKEASLVTSDTESATGAVSQILLSDFTRPRSRLTITDSDGNQTEFVVKTTAVIYNNSGAMFALTDIANGTKIQVNYKKKDRDLKEATSIKILE